MAFDLPLWGFVHVGLCDVGFCPMGFCPCGLLSGYRAEYASFYEINISQGKHRLLVNSSNTNQVNFLQHLFLVQWTGYRLCPFSSPIATHQVPPSCNHSWNSNHQKCKKHFWTYLQNQQNQIRPTAVILLTVFAFLKYTL